MVLAMAAHEDYGGDGITGPAVIQKSALALGGKLLFSRCQWLNLIGGPGPSGPEF